MIERGHHDLGGRPAGKVERDEHDYELWERRIDALAVLLGASKLLTVDQRRKNIEALPPELYHGLSYYERWLMSLAASLIERGLLTSYELATKIKEVGARGYHDMGGLPAGQGRVHRARLRVVGAPRRRADDDSVRHQGRQAHDHGGRAAQEHRAICRPTPTRR